MIVLSKGTTPMRKIRYLGFAALLATTAVSASDTCRAPQPVSPLSPGGAALRIMEVSGGADGESHVALRDLPRTGGTPGRSVQSRLHATDVEMVDTLPGDFIDFHGVSTPRLLIVLSGKLEIGLGDGSKHVLSKGDVVLANDVTGRGHTSRTLGNEPLRIMTVRLPAKNGLTPKLGTCPEGLSAEQCVANSLRITTQPPQ